MAGAIGVPHSLQNLIGVPHSLQNLECSGSSIPHAAQANPVAVMASPRPTSYAPQAKRFRHVAVAIPEVRVSRGIAVSPRQQSL